ncbi:hypothetical protein STEG23_021872, partial [Scotinomys teguina]
MEGNMLIPVGSMIVGPLPYLFVCEEYSLVRSNILWNNSMADKVLFKSTDDSFGTLRAGK